MTSGAGLGPWRSRGIATWLVANVIGLLVVALAAAQAAGRDDVSHQIPAMNAAVIGLLIGGAADAALLFSAWRRVTQRTTRIGHHARRSGVPSVSTAGPA
jgi:hypothetical protein